MTTPERPQLVVRLGELGEPLAQRPVRVLATRESGRRAREKLRQQADAPGDIVLDFDGVAVLADPFAQELLSEVREVVEASGDAGRIVIARKLEPDVRESLKFVLERRKQTLTYDDDGRVELLVDDPELSGTFRIAQRLGSFTAPEIAAELEIQDGTATHRLRRLLAAGAIVRERDTRASRGIRHLYHAVPGPPTYRPVTRA